MKHEAREHITRIFCSNHNIQVESLEDNLKILASEVYAPFLLLIECLGSNSFGKRANPLDGFFTEVSPKCIKPPYGVAR